MIRFIKYLLPVFIFASLIFYLSSIPGDNLPSIFPLQDILFHLIEYFIFSLLIYRAVKEYMPGLIRPRRICLTVLLCVIYALADELHQYFVPMRQMSFIDVLVDGMAAMLGSILYLPSLKLRWMPINQ